MRMANGKVAEREQQELLQSSSTPALMRSRAIHGGWENTGNIRHLKVVCCKFACFDQPRQQNSDDIFVFIAHQHFLFQFVNEKLKFIEGSIRLATARDNGIPTSGVSMRRYRCLPSLVCSLKWKHRIVEWNFRSIRTPRNGCNNERNGKKWKEKNRLFFSAVILSLRQLQFVRISTRTHKHKFVCLGNMSMATRTLFSLSHRIRWRWILFICLEFDVVLCFLFAVLLKTRQHLLCCKTILSPCQDQKHSQILFRLLAAFSAACCCCSLSSGRQNALQFSYRFVESISPSDRFVVVVAVIAGRICLWARVCARVRWRQTNDLQSTGEQEEVVKFIHAEILFTFKFRKISAPERRRETISIWHRRDE